MGMPHLKSNEFLQASKHEYGLTCNVREGTGEVLQLLLQEGAEHISLVGISGTCQINAVVIGMAAHMPPSLDARASAIMS